MKRRWLTRLIIVLVLFITVIGGFFIWSSWPTSATLVGQAARSDIAGIERSIFLGADIGGYSYYGWRKDIKDQTPLISAVAHGSLETVELLLSKGADPNQRSGSGMPPICVAAIHGRLNVCKALIDAGANPDDQYLVSKKTAIEYARDSEHNDVVAYLMTTANKAAHTNPLPARSRNLNDNYNP